MKIQIKIALLFTSLIAVFVILLSGFVYYFADRNYFQDFFKRLEIRAVIAAKANLEADENNVSIYNEIRREHLEKLPYEKEYIFKIDGSGDIQDTLKALSLPASFLTETLAKKESLYRHNSVFYLGFLYTVNRQNYLIVMSAKNEFGIEYMKNLRSVLIIGAPLCIILALSISLLFSRNILRPVRKITERAKDISSKNLHLRLEVKDGSDELGELALTFNNMLDRLETSFEVQNNFVSNASHELRTPLTTIMGEAEWALGKSRDEEDYKKTLAVIARQADRLDHITKNLLHLAQTGFDGKTQDFKKIRIDELLLEVQRSVVDFHPESIIELDFSLLPEDEEKLYVMGNSQLLQLAFSNIILNGCKYSNYKPVRVALASANETTIILIEDKGIGIPSNELKYIFAPFFRASNTGAYKGYGIGLPLTQNILRMHGGSITVNSSVQKGTVVMVKLPIANLD
ncbi:MAG: HAMP domain-containing histidine kinase [Filimonas sp.]|nr:HAMP domain-containing histidine kinase [Filimonas sp.]